MSNPKLLEIFEDSWKALAKIRSDARWRLYSTVSPSARVKYEAMAEGIGVVQNKLAQKILGGRGAGVHMARRSQWPTEIIEKLGTMSDAQLARVYHLSKRTVQYARVERNIPAFRSKRTLIVRVNE